MRFCSLGSGSTGNATLVESGGMGRPTRVLVDCGFSLKELALRLARVDLGLTDIDAVFVTHEHGDHVGCALTLARRHRVPVWTSRGTWQAIQGLRPASPAAAADEPAAGALDGHLHFARDGEAICIGSLRLSPYTVPHDAREPLQLAIDDGARRLGILTDSGGMTDHLLQHLKRSDALLLECNHDPDRLAACAYPASLKARIGGRLGHLSNASAAAILDAVKHPGLGTIVAAHLSEQNNSPALARAALAPACGRAPDEIEVADPTHGLGWRPVG